MKSQRNLLIAAIFLLFSALTDLAGEFFNGAVTNGISASVAVIYFPQPGISVYVRRQGESFPYGGTNLNLYWGATNNFCGPMELRDETGRNLRSLQPNLTVLRAYPDCFNLRRLEKSVFDQETSGTFHLHPIMVPGDVMENFLADSNRVSRLCDFKLTNFFKLKVGEEYKLTIWPKIYKRSETNNDIFKRIDIPPVTIPIILK
jgi:hypothetical protein